MNDLFVVKPPFGMEMQIPHQQRLIVLQQRGGKFNARHVDTLE